MKHAISFCFCALTGALLVAAMACPAHAQSGSRLGYVIAGQEAFALLPAEMIAGQGVVKAEWLPSGQGVLIYSHAPELRPEPPSTELRVSLWNAAAHRSRELWRRTFDSPPSGATTLNWLPTTQIAVSELSWQEKQTLPQPDGTSRETWISHREVLWTDLQRSQVREIPLDPLEVLTLSPTQPYGVLYQGTPGVEAHSVRVLRQDGVLAASVSLPNPAQINDVRWSADGKRLHLLLLQKVPENNGVTARWIAFNPVSGEMTALTATEPPAAFQPTARSGLLQLKRTPLQLKDKETSETVHSLWLETTMASERPRALVCAEGEQGQLSSRQDAVLYLAEQAAWVRPLMRMPKETLKAGLLRAQREVALSNARQLGLGLMMWAQDHDDQLPPPGDTQGDLLPYLHNESLFDGFTYTYAGGPLSEIENPSQTVLGTVDWSGGTILIYADGHAKSKE